MYSAKQIRLLPSFFRNRIADPASGCAYPPVAGKKADEPRRWRSPIQLLLLLAIIPATLLFFAYTESRESAAMATDINRSGSLRYRSLYLFAVTASDETGSENWPAALNEMSGIFHDLRLRHPRETARADGAWEAFDRSLQRYRHVSWTSAERMRIAADDLTDTLNAEAVRRSAFSDEFFWLGTLSLAFSLPLSMHLVRRLQVSQEENDRHIRSYADMSARFQNLFQNTPTACFVYNDQGRITDWNQAAVALFEKKGEQVRGQTLWDAIARPARREATKEAVDLLLTGEPLTGFDWIYDTPAGISKTITSTVTPFYANGIVIGGISVSTDVTASRAAEEKESLLLAELSASEQRLQNVTSGSDCLLWEADVMVAAAPEDYAGLFWNEEDRTFLLWDLKVLHEEEAYRWLPVPREPGQSFAQAWQIAMPGEKLAEINLRSQEAFRQGTGSYTQELLCQLSDGSMRCLLENVEVRMVAEETPRWYAVGVCTDITAQKQAEEKLRLLANELKRSNESLQEFAYVASHDLKEPLRKIQTFGILIQKRAKELLPAECGDYLARMISASIRMQTLVDGLLDYSRASRKPKMLIQVDLNRVVQEVLTDLEEQISSSGAQIVAGRLPVICTDAMQMRQLFQNLISNAIKFRKPDQAPTVTVCWEDECTTPAEPPAKATVRISVSDDGIGFDQRFAEHVFESFEKLQQGETNAHGTGLGLTICRTIVERFGGFISASSEPGNGAKFTIVLPVG